jgi:Uncharacterized conserved protein (DUF2303)
MEEPEFAKVTDKAAAPASWHATPWTGTPEGVGDLIDQSFERAAMYMRPSVAVLYAPDDNTPVPFVVAKDGVAPIPASSFDAWRVHPVRRQGTAVMTSLDSFCAHVNRFSDPDSVLFADDDRANPSIIAVLDYHERENIQGERQAGSCARFGTHRTVFSFPLSDEWNAWFGAQGTVMNMATFAAFLEDRIGDILEGTSEELPASFSKLLAATPSVKVAAPSTLYTLATSLKVFENSAVQQATNLASGEGELKFRAEHVDQQGNKLIVPSLFLIGIPVFRHGDVFKIAARLRYRKTGEGIVFWFDLHRADLVFDTAFKEGCSEASDETKLPLYFGAPERI